MNKPIHVLTVLSLVYTGTAMFIRLRGGNANEGRVEVSQDGVTWGTVCNDGWSDYNAHVVCREMGYKWGAAKRARYLYGIGTGSIFLDDVKCNGQETTLAKCPHAQWGVNNCVHTEDAAVTCHNDIIRLENGGSNHGIVYVLDDDKTWGVQCGDGFDRNAAAVVCRELGYQFGRDLPIGTYGKVENVHTKYVQGNILCSGSETTIRQCTSSNTCSQNPYNYGAVVCSNMPITGSDSIRLVSGLVMTETEGIWGSVCGSTWDDKDAMVACRQLGYPGGVAYSVASNSSMSPFLYGSVNCLGTERSLSECNRQGQACVYTDKNVKVAGVLCYEHQAPVLRLIEESPRVGRLEIEIDGRKGGICDTDWDVVDARVACQQLGYADGDNIRGLAAPYNTTFMTNVQCAKGERSVFECKNDGWKNDGYISACAGGKNFAGVECYEHAFLASTQSSAIGTTGSVLVFHRERWYHVCDQEFGTKDAEMVCKELGFPVGVPLISEPLTVDNKFRIFFLQMNCSDTSTSLRNCQLTETTNCRSRVPPYFPAAYASVLCLRANAVPDVQVHPPTTFPVSPVIQMYGINGTVCANGWDYKDARVYCRQFGYRMGFGIPTSTTQGANLNNPVVWMTNVGCIGWETDFRQCIRSSVLDKTKATGACAGGMASVYCI
ncbi:deleted in malignant brain tumors 1 protein-like [Ylistrum balloti]|uniref:deleted in malignant brain tumors 1 protein-like n=1 Tax=Ylistrum balloti TaxID=509963 RepID=UPI002905AC4D|nr:deleted in malignant brain tumors 1 protein-like [Ylistrum balloti]